VLETTGPVVAFLDAITARDLGQVAALLAHDVRLSVPPLTYTRVGAQDVVAAVTGLYRGFGELHYESRSRYVTPGTITDEALLVGRQTGPFLGAGPTQHVVGIPARVIITHDAASVTAVTLWPDLAALRSAIAGASRVIDLTKIGEAGDMVTALRASIPVGQARVIIGSARRERPPAPPLPGRALPTSDAGPTVTRTVPRAPLPKSVRRRRGVLAGSAMLLASAAMTTWVAIGALHTSVPGSTSSAATRQARPTTPGDPAASGRPSPPQAGTAATTDGPLGDAGTPPPSSAAGTPAATKLTRDTVTVTFAADLLFPIDSAALTPDARRVLDAVIKAARAQHRRGRVMVAGYTDSHGSTQYNLTLSQRRAAAVAAELAKGLRHAGLTFTSHGYGESHPIGTNDTDDGRRKNRRVTVTFPPATG
jgi:outer membrane protein OmpA-like peptidoglycan-associated protein